MYGPAALLLAVRTVERADSDRIRQVLYEGLRSSNRLVRAADWTYRRLGSTVAATLFVGLYGLKSWLTLQAVHPAQGRVLAVAAHANARRRLRMVAAICGPEEVAFLRTELRGLLRLPIVVERVVALARRRRIAKVIAIVGRIHKRSGFLVGCRVASLIGCYAASRDALTRRASRGILVSSDSNPEEIGLAAAACSLALPTIFASHAYPTSVSPRLRFDLAILEGEAALDQYLLKGPATGVVHFAGVEGVSQPLQAHRVLHSRPVVGIFAPKLFAWRVLDHLVEDCFRRFGADRVVIRWHPSMLERPPAGWHLRHDGTVEVTPRTATLEDVVDRCDWVVADTSSNVHLEVLKRGVPTVGLQALDSFQSSGADIYGFVANRVVYTVPTLADMIPDDLVAFYRSQWRGRFTRYDAGYLSTEDDRRRDLCAAIQQVLQTARTNPHVVRA